MITHTFLGPVTRLKVIGPAGHLIADMPTARAEALPVGSRVVAHIPDEGARLLSLPADGPRHASACRGRSVKMPVTPSAASSSIRAGSLTV